jgi:hypothetical protein
MAVAIAAGGVVEGTLAAPSSCERYERRREKSAS